MRQRHLIITIVTLSISAWANATFFEVRLDGVINYSVFGTNPAVGERCVIRTFVDDTDLESANTDVGVFAASPPRLEFPDSDTHLEFEPAKLVNFAVAKFGNGIDLLTFQSLRELNLGSDSKGELLDFSVSLIFPDQTFTTDALPLTLPLASANSTNFFISGGLIDYARGRVLEYSATPVPESTAMVLGGVSTCIYCRRPRRRWRRERFG